LIRGNLSANAAPSALNHFFLFLIHGLTARGYSMTVLRTFFFVRQRVLSAAGAGFSSHGRKAVDSSETNFEARRAGIDPWQPFS